MPPFQYLEPTSAAEAAALLAGEAGTLPLAGATDLLPLVRDGIVPAQRLVGIASLPELAGIAAADGASDDGASVGGGLNIGAGVSIAELAAHPAVRAGYAALAQAAAGLATPQIRNVGTLGGNLCQRPRCWYYRSPLIPCLKKGGDRCYALAGTTKYLCVTGGDRCYIVHPSDTAVALSALDAAVELYGPGGMRRLPIGDFFTGPGVDLRRENALRPGEIVRRVELPAAPSRSVYLKVRERESGDFALVSAAAALWLSSDGAADDGGGDNGGGANGAAAGRGPVIRRARVALGGVAPTPYRAQEVEERLTGRPAAALDTDALSALAGLTLDGATPLPQNGYKLPMAQGIVRRALGALLGVGG